MLDDSPNKILLWSDQTVQLAQSIHVKGDSMKFDSTSHQRQRNRPSLVRAFTTGIAALSLIGLTACAPGAQNTDTNAGGEISKDIPSEDITLTLTHFEVGPNGEAIDELITAYEKMHPNVNIEVSFSSFADYGQRIKLQMSADDAPDIAQAGQAFTMMGPLVEGGLLRPLDDYSELYGWTDRFGPGMLDQSRFEADGSKFGTGEVYGLALGGNMAGVFYNRSLLEQLGVDPEFKDIDEFQAALETAKAAGMIPIELGNADAWPANHLLSSLVSQYVDQEEMLAWIYGNEGASFNDEGFIAATEKLAEWSDMGYIDPAANGLGFDDAIGRFAAGNGAFFVTGNWALVAMEEQMGDNVGFLAFPPAKAGDPVRATGATTSPFTISSKSKYPDVAASFLDYMTGPDAVDIFATGGYAPLVPGIEVPGASALVNDYNAVWANVVEDDGLTLYLDWSTVAMGNTLFPAIQELIAGRTTPDDLNSAVQTEWETGRG